MQVDHEAVDSGQLPDVLVAFPDGRRFAFEVQYAPLTIDAWRARHAGYRAHGIVDIWLFGHIPPHLRAARAQAGEPVRFVFSHLLEAVDLAGCIARWIDPDERAVRTPLHAVGWRRVRSPSGAWLLVEAPPEPLDACSLDIGGLRAPATQLRPRCAPSTWPSSPAKSPIGKCGHSTLTSTGAPSLPTRSAGGRLWKQPGRGTVAPSSATRTTSRPSLPRLRRRMRGSTTTCPLTGTPCSSRT